MLLREHRINGAQTLDSPEKHKETKITIQNNERKKMNATYPFMIGLIFTLWPGPPHQSSLLELTFSISKKHPIFGTYFRSQTCERPSES